MKGRKTVKERLERERIVSEYHSQLASKGGRARAAKLTPEQRSEIAKKAVAAREAKRKTKKPKG